MSNRPFEARARARRRALQALYQWQMTGHAATDIVNQFLAVQNMDGVDTEWFESLVRGVVRENESLDAALLPFLDRSIEQLDEMEKVILRLGAFELQHHPELPYKVIVSECVDLAQRFASEQGHAYVNAVLDRASKDWRPCETSPVD